MKNERMRYISITAAILLVFVLLMLLFSNRSGDFSAMEAQNGVLDATSADFSSAVYEIDGEWAFYPEVLGSGAELNTAQPGERNESIPYGSYRLKIHAQPKQYLTLGGYSFDYSTRVLVNGSEVLEIGKVGASAAESEPRIDYMLIPIYTGEDGTVEVVCQYANFVHREGGGLTQMHLSTAENIDRMRRSRNLYSLVLGGSLCLFGMYFLLFAVFQGESKYVFLAVICVLLGLRDQNFYVLHLLPANYNWAVAYRFLVLMITLQPCFLLLLLQSLYEKLAKPIVVRCYTALYAVLAAAHFILPTQDIAPLSKIGYYLSMPFFLYLVVQLIRRFWRIRRFEWDDVLVLLGYLLLFGSNVYEAVFGRIVTTITRHGAAPPYLLVFVFLIAGAISLKINRREQELSESRRQREVLTQLNRLKSEFLHQMAHELKTPLTVMSGYAQLTDWQLGTGAVSADAHEHMQTISSEAQRLSALVSRLIDLANGGSPDIEMGVIDAAQLLSGAADVCRPMLEKAQPAESDSGDAVLRLGQSGNAAGAINPTVNANRHTENGMIAHRPRTRRAACLRVSAIPRGIAPDLLPHILRRAAAAATAQRYRSGRSARTRQDSPRFARGGAYWMQTARCSGSNRRKKPPLKTQGEKCIVEDKLILLRRTIRAHHGDQRRGDVHAVTAPRQKPHTAPTRCFHAVDLIVLIFFCRTAMRGAAPRDQAGI